MTSLIRKSILFSALLPISALLLTAAKQTGVSSLSFAPQNSLPINLPSPSSTNPEWAIQQKYAELGGEGGFLGKATMNLGNCPDGIGYFIRYQNGSIYWSSSTGAHEVHGAIREKWKSMGWERSVLGYPVTDESATPDGIGRYNHFQNGSIYWTPSTDAHELHGAIREKWKSMGWERSLLGYPVTDETPTPDNLGRYNNFQNGSIYWTPSTGAHEIHGDKGSRASGGSYTQSCRDISVSGTTLNATCKDNGGGWRATSLANFTQCSDEIFNANGTLQCNKGSGSASGSGPRNVPSGASPPPGSYTASCKDIRMKDGILYANCKGFSGKCGLSECWNSSQLSSLDSPETTAQPVGNKEKADRWFPALESAANAAASRSCLTEVYNIDGNLTCDRGTGPAPKGSYKQTCWNVVVNGTNLTATCDARSLKVQGVEYGGGARTTSLNISNCGGIYNDDGVLKCSGKTPPPPTPGFSGVNVLNCTGDHLSVHIWLKDITSGDPTVWDDKGTLPAPPEGVCPDPSGNSPKITIPLGDKHIYQIAATVPNLDTCTNSSGGQGPDNVGCLRLSVTILGKTGGQVYPMIAF